MGIYITAHYCSTFPLVFIFIRRKSVQNAKGIIQETKTSIDENLSVVKENLAVAKERLQVDQEIYPYRKRPTSY